MNSACLSPCIGIVQSTKQRKESNRTTEQRCFQACSYCHWSFLLSTNSWLNLFSINVFTCWRFSALAFYFFSDEQTLSMMFLLLASNCNLFYRTVLSGSAVPISVTQVLRDWRNCCLSFFFVFLMPKCGTESFHFVYSDCKNSSPFYSSFSRLKFFYIFNTMILPFYQWWSQDIFFWDRSRHWPRQRYRDMRRAKTFRIWSRRDKMRLRHSENVRDLRHCRDTGVKTWEEP